MSTATRVQSWPLLALVAVTILTSWCAIARTSADDHSPVAQEQVLNADKLGLMLEGMGYEPESQTLSGGHVIHTVVIEDSGWKFVLEFSLSFDGSRVWIIAPLGRVNSSDELPQSIAVKLLEENFSIQPLAFTYVPSAKKIDLLRTFENKGVTPAKLRSAIEQLQGAIKRTEALWNPARWEAPPKADRPSGNE